MSTDLERPPEEMARRPAGEGWLEMHIWRDIGWAVRCRPFPGAAQRGDAGPRAKRGPGTP